MGYGVLIIPVAAGILLWLLTRTGPLIDRLVSEATAFEGAPHPRPSHVIPPTPGTFAQAVEPLLPELLELPEPEPDSPPRPTGDDEAAWEAWSKALEALRQQCLDVASGKKPLEKLPTACRKTLDQSREMMRRVLAATHAEVGGLPAGAGSLSRSEFSTRSSGMGALEHVVALAALESRLLLAEHHVDAAVDTCLDALALSRELSLGGGLHGGKAAARSHDVVYRPCAAALDAASVERKSRALTQLARLREGLPPPSALLREESVFHQLATFGPDLLPPEAISRLPPAGQALVRARGGWVYFTSQIGHPLLRRYVWRRNVSLFDAMVAKADVPPAERQRAFARLDAKHSLVSGYPSTVSAVKFHQELQFLASQRIQSLMLSSLVEVDIARAQAGHWPRNLAPDTAKQLSIEVLSNLEAALTPRDAEFAGQALSLAADGTP